MVLVHILPVLLFCLSVCECQNDNLTVTLPNGKVKGLFRRTAYKGTPYYSFRGIPYAEPPVGNLRFKPPVEKSNWSGTLDATKEGSQCVQNIEPVLGSEDCLFINVYTPSVSRHLSTVFCVTKFCIYRKYRLGVFGFISTEDLVLLALKWVQKNIHLFGGNPEAVTLFGQSAGAASTSYHIQSPSAKGKLLLCFGLKQRLLDAVASNQ
nr:unnamed protein product [Callosobruchus chinensis]